MNLSSTLAGILVVLLMSVQRQTMEAYIVSINGNE